MIQSVLLPNLQGFVGGRWIPADSGETQRVINPADGQELAKVPLMAAAETVRAIEAAQASMQATEPVETRRRWLESIGGALLENKEELARIITLENGKPLKEGVVEVEYSAGFFQFFAGKLDEIHAHDLPEAVRGCRWRVQLRPAGVAGSITPWNFPLAMMAKKIAPALGAGCGVVVKPAGLTPLSAIAIATLAQKAEMPPGRLNLVMGSAGPIGETICSHPAVRIISFTGSTEVGKKLAAMAAPHVKRLTMELGGNAPFIVFEDADLEAAADALLANKFRSGGQTCVCSNRVYVHRAVAGTFTDAVVERVRKLRVGNGLDPDTDIGPLIHRAGFDKVAAHVRDALERGATRLAGEDPPRPRDDWGCFYPPTVLSEIQPEMLVCREETFGPVIAISQFDDEQRVLEAANNTEYGLAAYLFTGDEERGTQLASHLRFGHVGVNTGTGPAPQAPFGGMKQSGYGREGGLEGLLEFCEPQVVVTG